jgi:glycerol-3-phosphate O-acyltransferase/dihydroxyacetone phosphate acyltransferase
MKMLDRFLEFALAPVLSLMVSTFFRKIEITGAENVPIDTPVIYTPNHMNSLVDGILARTQLPREPRPLAAFKLWNVAALRPLLTAARAIPVYRQQDSQDPQYVENNRDMFSACYEALAKKYCIVVFPEGESHDGSELLKLKTGVARIALGAEQRQGPLGVRIVPVGLNFDAKQKFRSRVLLSIGEPIDPIAELAVVDAEDREAVTAVMDRVEQGIKSVTLNYPSWEEAQLIQRAAILYAAKQQRDSEREESLAEEFSVEKQLADAYLRTKESNPRRIARILEAVNGYDRLLRVLSVKHEHVVGDNPKLLQAIYSLRKLSLFLIRLPLSLIGIFLNIVPFLLTRMLSQLKIRADRQSTAKIFGGLILYPLCWTLQADLLSSQFFFALLWWLLAPLSGVSSLLFRERHAQLLEELRTYLKLNTHADMRHELAQRLETVRIEVAELLAFDAAQRG